MAKSHVRHARPLDCGMRLHERRSETQNDVCALSARYLPAALRFESLILVDNEEITVQRGKLVGISSYRVIRI